MKILMVLVIVAMGAATMEGEESRISKPFYRPYRDCGGVIPLSPLYYATINYKYGTTYSRNEFCVWTLAPTYGVKQMQVRIWHNITDVKDGITIYMWNKTDLESYKVTERNTVLNMDSSLAFLVFSSDGRNQSNGFRVRIQAFGEPGPRMSRAYHINNTEGTFKYSSFPSMRNEITSIVVQSSSVFRPLEINVKDFDGYFDHIYIYNILEYKDSPTHSLIGRIRNDTTLDVNSYYPLLFLRNSDSDHHQNRKGFSITWTYFEHFNKAQQ